MTITGMSESETEFEEINDSIAPEIFTPAGFWLRCWAYLIDYAILALPTLAVSKLIPQEFVEWLFGSNVPLPIDTSFLKPLLASLTSLGWFVVVGLFYFPLFESSTLRATPGKMVFRLYVSRRDGSPLSLAQALLRHIARATPVIPALLGSVAAGVFGLLGITVFAVASVCAGGFFSLVLSVIQYPLAAFTVDKRALHDLLADTYVFRLSQMDAAEVITKAGLATAISLCMAILVGALSRNPRLGMDARSLQDDELNNLSMQIPDGASSSSRATRSARSTPTPRVIATPRNFSRVNLAKIMIPPGSKHEISFPSQRGYTIGFDPVEGTEALASRCQNGCIELSGDGKAFTTSGGGIYVNPLMRRVDVTIKNLENFPVEMLVYREIPLPQ